MYSSIGLVFVVNKDENVDGNTDAGVALVRAFNYIMKQHGAAKALSFLTDVSKDWLSLIFIPWCSQNAFHFDWCKKGLVKFNILLDSQNAFYGDYRHSHLASKSIADSLIELNKINFIALMFIDISWKDIFFSRHICKFKKNNQWMLSLIGNVSSWASYPGHVTFLHRFFCIFPCMPGY